MKAKIAALAGISIAAAGIGTAAILDHSPPVEMSVHDEAAVYDAVLTSWLGKKHRRQLVDAKLSTAPSASDADSKGCAKGLDFPSSHTGEGRTSIAELPLATKDIELVDGSKWTPADPADAISKGKSVQSAVMEGFTHSLISLSQITFSRDGKDALVNFSMVCGSLCGSGSTVHLRHRTTGWAIVDRCQGWIS